MRRWPDDTVTTVWDCAPFYDSVALTDWCHTNSIDLVARRRRRHRCGERR